jgi:hypothetical protein
MFCKRAAIAPQGACAAPPPAGGCGTPCLADGLSGARLRPLRPGPIVLHPSQLPGRLESHPLLCCACRCRCCHCSRRARSCLRLHSRAWTLRSQAVRPLFSPRRARERNGGECVQLLTHHLFSLWQAGPDRVCAECGCCGRNVPRRERYVPPPPPPSAPRPAPLPPPLRVAQGRGGREAHHAPPARSRSLLPPSARAPLLPPAPQPRTAL